MEIISDTDNKTAQFEKDLLFDFAARNHVKLNFFFSTETVNTQLGLFQDIFKRQSSHPDIFEIDVVWPAILASDLIDLTPFFRNEISEFDPEIIRNFTVDHRLLALPTFLDAGVLYYRSDLLKKYGFRTPPSTWEDLDHMATVIQRGERRSGNRDFWGYVWQGGAYEGLTCNALEWQFSAGSPVFLDDNNVIHVRNTQMISVLSRAISWIGRISPPGMPYYRETDSVNVWTAGNAAFMRNWVSSYAASRFAPSSRATFLTAPLPGGPGGQRSTLGGLGMGISRYSRHVDLAIQTLRFFTGQASEELRSARNGTIPTRTALRNNAALMQQTALPRDLSFRVVSGLVSRPAVVSGTRYAKVSAAYFRAVNSALIKQFTPEEAMYRLERELIALGGKPDAKEDTASK